MGHNAVILPSARPVTLQPIRVSRRVVPVRSVATEPALITVPTAKSVKMAPVWPLTVAIPVWCAKITVVSLSHAPVALHAATGSAVMAPAVPTQTAPNSALHRVLSAAQASLGASARQVLSAASLVAFWSAVHRMVSAAQTVAVHLVASVE